MKRFTLRDCRTGVEWQATIYQIQRLLNDNRPRGWVPYTDDWRDGLADRTKWDVVGETDIDHCCITDVRAKAVAMVAIGDEGEAEYYEPSLDPGSAISFWCMNCRSDFSSWDEVARHLAVGIEASA
jgi:hypothetical protein